MREGPKEAGVVAKADGKVVARAGAEWNGKADARAGAEWNGVAGADLVGRVVLEVVCALLALQDSFCPHLW